MAPTTYEITINNNSNVDNRVYYLFQEKPVQSSQNEATTFTNIYAAAPPIASGDGSSVTFQLQKEYFAVLGTPPQALAKGVKVSTSSYVPVNIAKGGAAPVPGSSVFMTTTDDSPKWIPDKTTTTGDAENGFVINTDSSFEYPNKRHLFIGLGARDPFNNNKIIPVATIEALPGQEYPIFPKAIYYVCTGTYTQGTIIDYKTIGKKLKLDFGKSTIGSCSFTQDATGSYIPDDANSAKIGKVESS